MRPCSRWNPAGRPFVVERDDLAVDEQRRPKRPRQRLERPDDGGNCEVFSLPRRDQSRTSGRGLPGATWTSARMPSYFGSKTQALAGQRRLGKVASIGRTFEGSSLQAGMS